jgi:hypothetical protein
VGVHIDTIQKKKTKAQDASQEGGLEVKKRKKLSII